MLASSVHSTVAIPSNDTELTATSITYQSVSLSWSPPTDTGGYSTVNYIITVTLLSTNTLWNVSTDDDVTSYTVIGLESFQRYSFTARANNSVGEGGASNSVTVFTIEG